MRRRLSPDALARRYFRDRTHATHAEIDGVSQDVAIEADYSPAEPDVNAGEDLTVTAVWFEDEGCQLDNMTDAAIADLERRVLEDFHSYAEAYYCDED